MQQCDKTILHKKAIHPLFTVHMLRPLHLFSNIIWSKQSNPYIKMFNTLSGVRKVFFVLLQLDIFAQVQWKDTLIKTTIHRTRVTCFLCTGVHGSKKKTCYRLVGTSIRSISYSGELYSKNCIVKTSETLIVWSTFCCTAGFDKSDAIERCQTNC